MKVLFSSQLFCDTCLLTSKRERTFAGSEVSCVQCCDTYEMAYELLWYGERTRRKRVMSNIQKNWFKFLAPCRMNDWTPVVYQSIKNRKESKMPMMQRNWRTRRVTRQPKLSIWLAHFEFDNDVFEFFQFTKVKTYIITSFYHDIVLFTRTMQTLRSRSHQCSNTIDFSDDSWYVYAGKAKGKWSHLSIFAGNSARWRLQQSEYLIEGHLSLHVLNIHQVLEQ